MGEFRHVAEDFLRRLRERTGAFREYPGEREQRSVRAGDIPDLFGDETGRGDGFNCYPGIPGHPCYELALFISLQSREYIGNSRGHLTFREALIKLVQHMLGSCFDTTRTAVLITDNWNPNALDEWQSTIRRVVALTNLHLEIYLLQGDQTIEMFL